ncbi:MAG: class I adenylate-forming enzyme family protein [Planctomycetota bacterium]
MDELRTPIVAQIAAHAQRQPRQTALVLGERRLDYADLLEAIERCAAVLASAGLGSGSRIALFGDNSMIMAVAFLAIARLGALVAPLPPGLGTAARQRAIRRASCTAVIATGAILQEMRNAEDGAVDHTFELDETALTFHAREGGMGETLGDLPSAASVDSEAPYILTMTSGSTGDPKPIVFSQATKLRRAFLATRDVYRLHQGVVVLVSTPMHHSLAQRSTLLPLLLGGTAVILPRFTPASWIDAVQENGVHFLFAVSSQLRVLLPDLIARAGSFPTLRCLVSSSAPLETAAKADLAQALDCDLHECYGTSEIGCATDFSVSAHPARCGTVGRALPFVQLRISDKNGAVLPVGTVGEILVRSVTAFIGYDGDADATAAAHDTEGFFRTGDLGRLDEEGWLHFKGRCNDIIITGGINVHPSDVEAVVSAVPGVTDCAVVGIPDAYFGEAVLAVVVSEGEDERAVLANAQRQCARELAAYQRPLAWQCLSSLPQTAVGKVDKPALRKRFQDIDATARFRAMLLREQTVTDKEGS